MAPDSLCIITSMPPTEQPLEATSPRPSERLASFESLLALHREFSQKTQCLLHGLYIAGSLLVSAFVSSLICSCPFSRTQYAPILLTSLATFLLATYAWTQRRQIPIPTVATSAIAYGVILSLGQSEFASADLLANIPSGPVTVLPVITAGVSLWRMRSHTDEWCLPAFCASAALATVKAAET
jgi:hypothetical protein